MSLAVRWLRIRLPVQEMWVWSLVRKLRFHMRAHAQSLSGVWLFATLRTVDCQPPLSMGFSWQEPWSGLPFPTPEDSQPRDWTHVLCPLSPLHWQAGSLPLSHLESPKIPHASQLKTQNINNRSNIVTDSIKTLQMVHVKNISKKIKIG